MLTCDFTEGPCHSRCKCGQECPPNEDPLTYLQQCPIKLQSCPIGPQVGTFTTTPYFSGKLGSRIAKCLKKFGIKQKQSCGCQQREETLDTFSGWLRFKFATLLSKLYIPLPTRIKLDLELQHAATKDRELVKPQSGN